MSDESSESVAASELPRYSIRLPMVYSPSTATGISPRSIARPKKSPVSRVRRPWDRNVSTSFKANISVKRLALLRQTIEEGSQSIDRRVDILNRHGEMIPVSISTAVYCTTKKAAPWAEWKPFGILSDIELLRKEIDDRYTFADIISKNHIRFDRFWISCPTSPRLTVPC